MSKLLINNQNKVLINSNGKALAVSGNIKIGIDSTRIYAWINSSNAWVSANDSYSILIPVTKGAQYRMRFTTTDSNVVGSIFRWGFTDNSTAQSQTLNSCNRTSPQDTPTVTVTATKKYLVVQMGSTVADKNINENKFIVEAII